MTRYVAFLRGMNLGGRRITNDELCRHVTALGFEDVSAFLASGNVVLEGKGGKARIEARLERGLAAALDYEVPVFLRDGAALREVAAATPFPAARIARTAGKLQVAFLRSTPSAAAKRLVRSLDGEEDGLVLAGLTLYCLPTAGISDSQLDWRALEKALGSTTVRTARTVQRLVAKHFDD